MIKLLSCKWQGDFVIFLEFSDGLSAYFDLNEYILNRHGSLLDPLHDETFAQRCFIDAGALCWPHGLELSPVSLHKLCLVAEVA